MRVWLIGCGNMAGAMLRRWIASGTVRAEDVFVANRHDRTLPDRVGQGRALPAGPPADVVLLGVKPQQLREAAAAHGDAIAAAPLLISILAGTDAATLRSAFPGPEPIPCLPNLPVEIGAGVVPIHAPEASAAARAVVDRLMAPLGAAMWFDDPARYAAASALSGCGPAFVYRFIDALAQAARAAGLDEAEAAHLAKATVAGAGALAQADARTPGALADAVASPGGMTRAGLDVLDEDGAIVDLMARTIDAAIARGAEMARAVRGGD